MTLYAYQHAVEYNGLTGMEVSIHLSSDGVLVCNHDADTARLGSKALVVAYSTWSELKSVMISARETNDPQQPARPIARLEQLMEWWPRWMPLWIEPKDWRALVPLRTYLSKLDNPPPIVWKQPINAGQFSQAKKLGWGTWGYILTGAHQQQLAKQFAGAPSIDRLGAWLDASNAEISTIVSLAHRHNKQAVIWAVDNRNSLERAVRLGADGLMVSNVARLVPR